MPLIEVKSAGKIGKTALWHISESLEELLRLRKPENSEKETFDNIQAEHRKKEWLVIRILAAKLCGNEAIHIIYDACNKPHFSNSDKHLSVSHSHELLSVVVDNSPTGIDIELIKPTVMRIKDKFISTDELAQLPQPVSEEALTLCWCVKESLYKYYGKKELRFKEHLLVKPFTLQAAGSLGASIRHPAMNRDFKLQYEKLRHGKRGFMLAYVINE